MERSIVRLSSKGQLTIPAEIRRKLGLKQDTKLFVTLERDGEVKIKRVKENRSPVFTSGSSFFALIGTFSGPEDLAENHDRHLAEDFR